MQHGPQPWRVALTYLLQATRALMAAHDKHLVHRDLKPANLMLVAEAGEDELVVKVIDFGLAKSLVELGGSVVNVSGSGFVGTPLYASPEQCEEIAPDIRSDIYSLGVVLWYVLTGKPLFTGPLGRVFAQHIHAEPAWNKLPADLPENVRALLARMLAKDRADRPQTPAELRREIDGCLRPASEQKTTTPFVLDPAPQTVAPFAKPLPPESSATLAESQVPVPVAGTLATLVGYPARTRETPAIEPPARIAPTADPLPTVVPPAVLAPPRPATLPPRKPPTPLRKYLVLSAWSCVVLAGISGVVILVTGMNPGQTPEPLPTPAPSVAATPGVTATPTAPPMPSPIASPSPAVTPLAPFNVTPATTPAPTIVASSPPVPAMTAPTPQPAKYRGELRAGTSKKASGMPVSVALDAGGNDRDHHLRQPARRHEGTVRRHA